MLPFKSSVDEKDARSYNEAIKIPKPVIFKQDERKVLIVVAIKRNLQPILANCKLYRRLENGKLVYILNSRLDLPESSAVCDAFSLTMLQLDLVLDHMYLCFWLWKSCTYSFQVEIWQKENTNVSENLKCLKFDFKPTVEKWLKLMNWSTILASIKVWILKNLEKFGKMDKTLRSSTL